MYQYYAHFLSDWPKIYILVCHRILVTSLCVSWVRKVENRCTRPMQGTLTMPPEIHPCILSFHWERRQNVTKASILSAINKSHLWIMRNWITDHVIYVKCYLLSAVYHWPMEVHILSYNSQPAIWRVQNQTQDEYSISFYAGLRAPECSCQLLGTPVICCFLVPTFPFNRQQAGGYR